jgi:hypothetical protein
MINSDSSALDCQSLVKCDNDTVRHNYEILIESSVSRRVINCRRVHNTEFKSLQYPQHWCI